MIRCSLDFELRVLDVLSFYSVLSDIKKSDATARWRISVASKSDAALNEFLAFSSGHVLTIVGVDVTPDEGTSWTREGPVTCLKVTWRVNLVNLIALVRIPTTANHGSRKWIFVWVDNFSHDLSSWLNGREVVQLVANISWKDRTLTLEFPCNSERIWQWHLCGMRFQI